MSVSTSRPEPPKKISCWVRPGVFEVRASARRPVSALIRLDLPTLERPANAISGALLGGPAARPPAAGEKSRPWYRLCVRPRRSCLGSVASGPHHGAGHRIAHNGPLKKQKGDVASP